MSYLTRNALSCAVLALFLLSGCGGGGGSDGDDGGGTPTPTVSPITYLMMEDLLAGATLADLDLDGDLDLLVGPQKTPNRKADYPAPVLLLNDGDGHSFTQKIGALPNLFMGIDSAAAQFVVRDVNGDGLPDVFAVAHDVSAATAFKGSMLHLFLNQGQGKFGDASDRIANALWPDNAPCGAYPKSTSTGFYVDAVRVADFDGDGHDDLLPVTVGGNSAAIFRGNGSGDFVPAPVYLTSGGINYGSPGNDTVCAMAQGTIVADGLRQAEVGDINGDNKPDIVVPFHGDVLINTSTPGDLSFDIKTGALPTLQIGVNPNSYLLFVTLIDVNGDGFRDALTYTRNATVAAPVHAFINNGTGTFVWDDNVFIGGAPMVDNPAPPLIADFNSDGLSDFLFPNAGYDGEPYPGAAKLLLFATADHRLQDVTTTNFNLQTAPTYASAVGDIDKDGKPDVFLANGLFGTGTGQARYWLNKNAVLQSYTPTFK